MASCGVGYAVDLAAEELGPVWDVFATSKRLLVLDKLQRNPLADALQYTGRQDLFHTDAFQNGQFEIQDLASQTVSLAADPKPGRRTSPVASVTALPIEDSRHSLLELVRDGPQDEGRPLPW